MKAYKPRSKAKMWEIVSKWEIRAHFFLPQIKSVYLDGGSHSWPISVPLNVRFVTNNALFVRQFIIVEATNEYLAQACVTMRSDSHQTACQRLKSRWLAFAVFVAIVGTVALSDVWVQDRSQQRPDSGVEAFVFGCALPFFGRLLRHYSVSVAIYSFP